jgi:hypothetical protein
MKMYPLDVRKYVYDTVVSDLATMIETINTERAADYTGGLACPITLTPNIIVNGTDPNQYPAVFIDVDFKAKYFGNEEINIPSVATLKADIPIIISATLKSADVRLNDWEEVYIEALTRIFEGKKILKEKEDGSFEMCGIIEVTGDERDWPINTRANDQTKLIRIDLIAHIFRNKKGGI